MIDPEIAEKLKRLAEETEKGLLGVEVQNERQKMLSFVNPNNYYINFVSTLYNPPEPDIELYKIGQRLCEYILILYRDSKLKDEKVAKALFLSLFNNFPDTNNTNLFDRYKTLVEVAYAYLNSIKTSDRLLIWNTAKSLFESYNEFLNGLLGYINICAKCAIEKNWNKDVLINTYNAKIDEFNSLKLNLEFPVFSNLFQPEIRNAIAHCRLSLNHQTDIVEYKNKKGKVLEDKSIDLINFIALAAAGTYLPIGYMSAISTIYIFEYGNIADFYLLSEEVKSILNKYLEMKNQN